MNRPKLRCTFSPHGPTQDVASPSELGWLAKMAERNGYKLPTPMGGGKWCAISPFAFTMAIITGEMYDNYSYADRWCYDSGFLALKAMQEWAERGFEGEPIGWQRHPDTGRRRPGGDPAKEFINL